MAPIVVTDIKQLNAQYRTPDMLRFLECALAIYKIEGRSYTLSSGQGGAPQVLEYGKVRGLRNVTGLAAYTLTLRKNKKMTQAQLAAKTGVPATVISQIENGVLGEAAQYNSEYLSRLATYLGFSVGYAMRLQ